MALRTQTDANTVIVGDLNTSLSPTDRSSRQKMSKETSEILHTLDQLDMADIYRVFHTTTRQYKFFSAAQGTFSKIDYILRHKARLNKYKKIEITYCILSDHKGIKVEINSKRYYRKYSSTWRRNSSLLNDQ
jgi:exonuclease III